MTDKNRNAFSLMEVLVVVSTVSVMMAVTMPAITKAKMHARAIVCRSNLRQLVLANLGYAGDNDGFFVPAAEDYWLSVGLMQGGYHRWHGVREGSGKPFAPQKGPLAGFLADGKVKECPQRVEFIKDLPGNINFELGCGGYGYNMQYLGSRLWRSGIGTLNDWKKAHAKTTNITEVKTPAATLMFSDTAFYQQGAYLVEYSFAQPPYWVADGQPDVSGTAMGFPVPSIHFRHGGRANIGWADGHIEAKPMAKPILGDNYTAEMASMNIGWFEPVDNTLFDLK